MAKPAAFAKQIQQKIVEARMLQRDFTRQQCEDIALIVLADRFGFGGKRDAEFRAAFRAEWDDQVQRARLDGRDDPDIVYTLGKIDEKLEQVLGQDYEPYDDRYGFCPPKKR